MGDSNNTQTPDFQKRRQSNVRVGSLLAQNQDSLVRTTVVAAMTETRSEKTNKRILLVTYINIVLYALCYQLQGPVEPFLVKELSKEAETVVTSYGRLLSFFSTIQTVGSPFVGILLDRIGIRNASAMVFLASAASYAILSQAKTMDLLFWSKVPTALQHAFLVAQAIAATTCQGNEASRAQALGRMTTAYTIG